MDDMVLILVGFLFHFLVVTGIFFALFYISRFIANKLKNNSYFESSRFFNPKEYLPEEELSSIRQLGYLIMILILIIFILYSFISWQKDLFYMVFLDIIVSLYLAVKFEGSSSKNRILLFSLVPFGSIAYLLFSFSLLGILDWVHIVAYLYFIKQYYHKFVEFTENNSLGITIIFLFLIIFISFFFTILVEGVSPLDSINMVSNAFTSNGYTILGSSGWGKINAIFLVWSGFILSGVGTATLTVAIVMRQVNSKFDRLEELARKNKKK